MAEKTYLTTSFREKDRVKALGARWDPGASKWYVPGGVDLTPFVAWLPSDAASTQPANTPSSETRELASPAVGMPLSQLLSTVATTVARAFSESLWTTAEVVRASVNNGHYYLELSERDTEGNVVAQTRAVIWAGAAQKLLAEFRRATGAELDANIKVLLRVKPVFKARFGFSLEVDGIDPSYTLGDLEAKKRNIRERLNREGMFDRNRRLTAPWDYFAVLVVAPAQAAGLGDFAKEAQRLDAHGVCQFSYAHSRFQGEGAAAEIVRAIQSGIRTWSGPRLPDAVVIIRGGGAVNDLAWLNDYELARCICECEIPVLTGIGHERDETSIDEVAYRKFDTPSKVILGIEDMIRSRVRSAQANFELAMTRARAHTNTATNRSEQRRQQIEQAARSTISRARADTESSFNVARQQSLSTIHEARTLSRTTFDTVRNEARAQVVSAQERTPNVLSLVHNRAMSIVGQARHDVDTRLPLILERAASKTQIAKGEIAREMRSTFESASRGVSSISERSQALFREIAGQGPQKTLRRGFAMVRLVDGKTVTTANQLKDGGKIEVSLRDGVVDAVVSSITPSTDKIR